MLIELDGLPDFSELYQGGSSLRASEIIGIYIEVSHPFFLKLLDRILNDILYKTAWLCF